MHEYRPTELRKAGGSMNREQKEALTTLLAYRGKLTRQQYRTFKGQIEAGDVEGFRKGLEKVLKGKSE